MEQGVYDVIVVGAGAVGCAAARELSRYELSVLVLEKEADVAAGTSGRNSAVVHAGFNSAPGSLMAALCVEGNLGFEAACRELDVPYRKTGKLVTAFDDRDRAGLDRLMDAGRKNGTPGLELIERDELSRLEPHVGGIAALLSSETAITSPFLYTVALAENAAANGVRFLFGHRVTSITVDDAQPSGRARFTVRAGGTRFQARMLVNSGGLFSDEISAMAGHPGYRIYPCRGEYHILDVRAGRYLTRPVYPVPRPGEGGLGVHLTPTVDGNILIGPSAEYISEREDCATTGTVMDRLAAEAHELLPPLDFSLIIRSYAGIRAKLTPPGQGGYADFVIEESSRVPGLVNLIGIESPGLTASLPIARRVCAIVGKTLPLVPRPGFSGMRSGIPRFRELPDDEKQALIVRDPAWGEIVCSCERVTKREILEAAENPLGVRTLAGIKYRTHALAGRCQGGSCLARITGILMNELGMRPEEITERGPDSPAFSGKVK